MIDATWFSVDESAALLRRIYPNYPDTRNPQPHPDLEQFLQEYRSKKHDASQLRENAGEPYRTR